MYTSFLKRVLGKVHFEKAVRLYMYVYFVLKACAQERDRQTVLPHTRDKTRKYSKSS